MAIRGFLLAFGVTVAVLMTLISMVFVGSTLMNDFAGLADMGRALLASAVLSLLLAVPLATAGNYGRPEWMIQR